MEKHDILLINRLCIKPLVDPGPLTRGYYQSKKRATNVPATALKFRAFSQPRNEVSAPFKLDSWSVRVTVSTKRGLTRNQKRLDNDPNIILEAGYFV